MSLYQRLLQEEEEKKKITSTSGGLYSRLQTPTKEPLIKEEPAKPSVLARVKQKLEPVGKFLLEKRKQLGEEIGRLAPIRPAYAPAPEGEPGAIEELEESYKNSLVGKFDDRFRTFEKGFITARTGGIIKPEYQSEDNLTNKVISGVAQVAGASASLRSIGNIFDGVTQNAIPIKTLLERFPKVAKYAYPLVKNAVVFDIYGQLDPDLQDRFETLAKDTLLSIPFTGLGFVKKARYSVPASFGLGFGLAKLNGAEDEDAFISGSIVAAFDAFGRLKSKDKEFVSGRAADKIMKTEAIETLNRYSDVKLSASPTEAQVNAAWKSASKKTHPDVGGTNANQRAVNTAKDYLLGKDIALTKVEPTEKKTPAEARKPGEIPEGLPPEIQKEVTKPSLSLETVAKINEGVKTQAAIQIEGIRTGLEGKVVPDNSIPEGTDELITKISVAGAANPTEAAELILKGLPEEIATHPEVVDTVTKWGRSRQDVFESKIREVAKPPEPEPPEEAEIEGKFVSERQAAINEAKRILDDLPTVTPKIQEQADEVIKEAAKVQTKGDLQVVEQQLLHNFRLAAAKFATAQKKVEKPDVVTTYGEKAKDYVSVEDFTKAEFAAKPSDQIGFMDASKIKARDPIDEKAVKEYESKIEKGETIEPIEVAYQEEAKKAGFDVLETIEGSQRVTAYQNLGREVPTIFRGEGKIEGLQTFQEFYDSAVKKAKEGVGITFKMIDKETIEKYAVGVPYREKIVDRVPLESIKSITMDKMLESPTGELFDVSGRDKEDIFLTGKSGEPIKTTFEEIKDYKRLVTKKVEKPEVTPPTVEEAKAVEVKEAEPPKLESYDVEPSEVITTKLPSDLGDIFGEAWNQLEKFKEPIEAQISSLKDRVATLKGGKKEVREAKKILNDKIDSLQIQISLAESANKEAGFEFNRKLGLEILKLGKKMGVDLGELGDGLEGTSDKAQEFRDEVMMAIYERPGIEHYWSTPLPEVVADFAVQFGADQGKIKEVVEVAKEAPPVEKEPAPKEFGLKSLHLKEGKVERLAAAGIKTTAVLRDMSADEVADLWTKSVGDRATKDKLLEASRLLSVGELGEVVYGASFVGRAKLQVVKVKDKYIIRDEATFKTIQNVPSEDAGRAFMDGVDKGIEKKGALADELRIKKAKYFMVQNRAGGTLLRSDRKEVAESYIEGYKYGGTLTYEAKPPAPSKPPTKPKAPPKKKPIGKVKTMKPSAIKRALGKPQISTLEFARAKDGLMTFNNLSVEIALPTELKDGLYEIVGDDFIHTDVPLDDFPPPVGKGKPIAKIDFKTIADILTKHRGVVAKDESRPILTASLFDFGKDRLRVISTDGFRMLVTDHPEVKTDKPIKVLSPPMREIYKFRNVLGGGKVEIGHLEGANNDFWMSFDSDYSKLTGRELSGEFPKIEKVYPASKRRYTVDRKKLVDAVKALKPYAKDGSNIFSMRVDEADGTLTVAAEKNRAEGEKKVGKEVELPLKTEKIKIPKGAVVEGTLVMPVRQEEGQGALVDKGDAKRSSFNINYFGEALTSLAGDNVHIQTGDPSEKGYDLVPVVVTDKITEVLKAPSGTALAIGDYADVKSIKGELNFYKAIQFPELVRLTKELTGDYPQVSRRLRTALGRAVLKVMGGAKVELHPDIFKDNEMVGKVLAHELGHIADFFPDKLITRGNVVGRVASLIRYMKKEYEGLDDKVLREELRALTQAWSPFNEAQNINYTKYRYSARELYAEAISVLFNDPALLKERAPEFWGSFFKYLDRKPKVKEEVFAIWDLLNKGEGAVLSERQKSIREMFDKGEDAFLTAVEEKRMADKDILFKLKYELIDRNQLVIDKLNALKKKGINVSDEMNPVYWLEGHNYVGGVTKTFMEENIQPVYDELKAAGLTWEDLGEVLFLDRVTYERGAVQNPYDYLYQRADEESKELHLAPVERVVEEAEGASIRSFSASKQHKLFEKYASKEGHKYIKANLPKGIANPLGFGRDTAQPQKEFLKKQLGPDKWRVLTKQMSAFRKAIKSVVLEAEDEGFYNKELIKEMKANPAYATFQVLDYLDINISASIKHQVGTLKEIANPASSTVIKTISTIRAIERNKVKKKIIGFMDQYYPKEIEPAKTIWTGKTHKPVDPRGRERDKKALFTAMIDGKYKGFYVDPYIAKTMEYMGTGQANAVVQTIRFFNSKLFRPLFITFNLGFQSFNLVRDFMRFYKNTPQLSLARAVGRYKQAAKPAFRRAWDIPDETISKMQKEKMLGITYNDVIAGMTTADKQIDFAIAKAGLSPLVATKRRFFIKPFIPIFETIEKTGNFIESLPKVAGYKELNGKMPNQELASFIRTSVGSPDFLCKGAGYGWYNELFLFSNAIKEGVRADYNVAFKNPKTRSGYWWKTAWTTFLPKLLMFGALMGLFGKKVKDMFEDVSEYDKTNYTILPMGKKNNLTTYLRIPQDETGRLIGGLFWKVLRFANNDKPIMKDVTDLLSYTGGQIPSVSPIVDLITATAQFASGKNPYDYFRGRNVIPDDQFEAGGKYALKPFLTWQLNQVGAGIFFKTYTSTQPIEGKGWVQKVIEAPLLSNIIGRWIKISNYGQREKNKAIVSGERQEAAKRRIEERELVNDAVKEYRAGTQNMTQRKRIEKQLVKDIVGEAPYKAERKAKKTNTIKKFHLALIKGESDEDINALIYAQSNDEKLALLVRIREDMEKVDFEALLKRLKQEKIVSSGVVSDLRKIK